MGMTPLMALPQGNDMPFKSGEQLNYDISYKYGIIMMKAGAARFRVSDYTYNHKPAILTTLDFKTTSFFDKVYKIRDTLYSYSDVNLTPLYHKRHVNEGNTNFTEQLFFLKQSKSQTKVRVKRENATVLKFDTIMITKGPGYDLLNVFSFARALNYEELKLDQAFQVTTFVGKRQTKINIRYKGQSLFEKSETLKYNTVRFEIDIVDEVFDAEKTAMEIWISNDRNRIPVKLKAKLKIGAAEAVLSSYKNLKYPFTSEVRIKNK